jgi:3-dehydroquinate synthase
VSDNFIVRSSIHDYEVRFEDDFAIVLDRQIDQGNIILIDENVYNLYKTRFISALSKCEYILIKASEEQKSYLQLAPIIESLIEKDFKKNNKLIVIGGGITQDIGAFIASNMYRGVSWFFYPTTLLAQCDSCIGGKSSINFGKYKNQLGNFYPPNEIIIDLRFLDTLAELDIRSGLGEMIHFYLVSGHEDFNKIRSEYEQCLTDKNVLKSLIYRSLQIKKKIIEIDEFDKKERLLFNYGHSFGHAIESLTNYRIPHGIAVSYGMDIANYLSENFGYIQGELRQTIRELLEMNWKGVALGRINVSDFIDALKKDKKNVGSEVKVILTRGFGQMFKTTLPIDNKVIGLFEEYFNGGKE